MRFKTLFVSISLMVLAALAIFQFFESKLSELWIDLALHPEIQELLTLSAEDQKALSRLDPDQASAYRARFDRTQRIRNNLFILENYRREMAARFRIALWSVFAMVVLVAAMIQWRTGKRRERRLALLRGPIEALAEGKSNIQVGITGRDAVARIGAMIEKTSHVLARQKEQIRYLRHLSTWQEASRRHAHEMRTPLTAASLELDRLIEITESTPEPLRADVNDRVTSVQQELARLKRFTHDFTAFARVREPQLERVDLAHLVSEFTRQFGSAWPSLTLHFDSSEQGPSVKADPEMVRQVLANLCSNSAKAMADRGSVTFVLVNVPKGIELAVADDGPGIAPEVRDRVFEPYVTTGNIGENMGLGLAIARKMMLDQGGDLVLRDDPGPGACFSLLFPHPNQPR